MAQQVRMFAMQVWGHEFGVKYSRKKGVALHQPIIPRDAVGGRG